MKFSTILNTICGKSRTRNQNYKVEQVTKKIPPQPNYWGIDFVTFNKIKKSILEILEGKSKKFLK